MSDKPESTFKLMVLNDEKLKVFNDTVPAGILVLRVDDGRVIYSNRFFQETLGADGEQVFGESWDEFFVDSEERQNLMIKFVEDDEVRNFELRLRHKNGGIVWGLASMASIPIEDEDLLMFAFIDVTQLKEAEAKIQALANYDILTELPSRLLFSDRLGKAMNRAERAETEMALLFIDLDGFKAVNNTLGHEAGDRMGYEVVKVYEDEVSGAKSREKRPAYSKLCKDAFLKKFDIIIGWDVSRFGRSMKEFVHFLSDMDDKGCVEGSAKVCRPTILVLNGSEEPHQS